MPFINVLSFPTGIAPASPIVNCNPLPDHHMTIDQPFHVHDMIIDHLHLDYHMIIDQVLSCSPVETSQSLGPFPGRKNFKLKN